MAAKKAAPSLPEKAAGRPGTHWSLDKLPSAQLPDMPKAGRRQQNETLRQHCEELREMLMRTPNAAELFGAPPIVAA